MILYNAGRPLRGKNISWGKSVDNFVNLTTATGVKVQKELEAIVDRTGIFLKRNAENLTPVKTGKAKESWARSTTGRGRDRKVTVFNTARTPKGLYYLNFVERGTRYITPRRFFLRAVKIAEAYQQRKLVRLKNRLARRFNRGANS